MSTARATPKRRSLEYGDYECPYCGMAYPIVKELQRRFKGHMRFVFRNFPLSESHPHAEHAAESAEAVADLGGNASFWAMHDALYENQNALDDESLADIRRPTWVSTRTRSHARWRRAHTARACAPISRAGCGAE